MKRFTLPACMAAALTVVPAYSAEHGWYVGTGIGYSKADVSQSVITNSMNTVAPDGRDSNNTSAVSCAGRSGGVGRDC